MLTALWWVCAHHHKEIRLGSPFYIDDIKKVDFWAAKLCFELGLKFLFFDKKR